jgi:ATP-dependent Clp protease ATP-binding subunit ClpA
MMKMRNRFPEGACYTPLHAHFPFRTIFCEPEDAESALYCSHTNHQTVSGHDMAEKFEKFTERARKVFSLAQEEAQYFNHNYIGTEHLLLGLVREGGGIAARVLDNLGVSLAKVRSAVEFIIGRGDGIVVGDPKITPRAKKVIRLAMDEARRLNSESIGTEHLLLGIVREGGGIAAGVLESLGVGMDTARARVLKVIDGQPLERASSQTSTHSPLLPLMPLRMLGFQDKEIRRLDAIAKQHSRSLDDLVREAVRLVWLTEEGDVDQPPPPARPPQAGEESL